MDKDELEWAIEDVYSEREKAISQVVELSVTLRNLEQQLEDIKTN